MVKFILSQKLPPAQVSKGKIKRGAEHTNPDADALSLSFFILIPVITAFITSLVTHYYTWILLPRITLFMSNVCYVNFVLALELCNCN